MTDNGHKSLPTIGFLTVVEHQETGLTGGYLVLNTLGRPVEFHCTAPLKTNRAQEILYGPTLRPFLYGEQIGQTLGASTAAVDSAQARVVKEAAELENVHAQTERVFELVKRGVYPASKADTARAAQDAARAVLTASQADLAKAREEFGKLEAALAML